MRFLVRFETLAHVLIMQFAFFRYGFFFLKGFTVFFPQKKSFLVFFFSILKIKQVSKIIWVSKCKCGAPCSPWYHCILLMFFFSKFVFFLKKWPNPAVNPLRIQETPPRTSYFFAPKILTCVLIGGRSHMVKIPSTKIYTENVLGATRPIKTLTCVLMGG